MTAVTSTTTTAATTISTWISVGISVSDRPHPTSNPRSLPSPLTASLCLYISFLTFTHTSAYIFWKQLWKGSAFPCCSSITWLIHWFVRNGSLMTIYMYTACIYIYIHIDMYRGIYIYGWLCAFMCASLWRIRFIYTLIPHRSYRLFYCE